MSSQPPPPWPRPPRGSRPPAFRKTRPRPPGAGEPGRRHRPPLAPLPELLMNAGSHWAEPDLRQEDAERYAREWAQDWFDVEEVRLWLDAGASISDGPGAAALRDIGVPPSAGCLPLFDDGTLRRGGVALVARVTVGNLTAEGARALLERTGHLPSRPSRAAKHGTPSEPRAEPRAGSHSPGWSASTDEMVPPPA
jgi:hypothetical protein